MKLIILKDNLKTGLVGVERAVLESGNLPILKNILIKTAGNKIKISATNLELGINKFISGKIIEEGGLTVPFNTFYNIVTNTDTERINLETDKNNLIIKTDNYQARIQGISEDEFPIIPKTQSTETSIEINTLVLKNSLLQIISAAQFSEIRPEISGVLFDFQVTVIKLVATDSFRLAEKTLYNPQFKTNFTKGFKIIIPLKTIQEIIRIFTEDQAVNIHIDPNQIFITSDGQELISRLIDGQYPDYEQIIPKGIETELTINREKFAGAIKLVSSLSGKVNDIKLRIKDTKAVEIYSANQYLGENSYLIPAKIKGPEFKEVTFNWRYLLDGLKVVETENLLFGINGDTKPAVIKPTEEPSYFYLLMPIKAT